MNQPMSAYKIIQIGLNRGKPRIYIQGEEARRAGFLPSEYYEISVENKRLILTADSKGSRKITPKQVHGRTLPVIDINSIKILGAYEGMTKVRAVFTDGVIYIMPLSTELKKSRRLERLKERLKKNIPLTIGSLSHGGGILSHAVHKGFEKAGVTLKTAFANEIEEKYIQQSAQVNESIDRDTLLINAPMQEFAFDYKAMEKLNEVDGMEMGLSCSGASVAGRAKRKISIPEAHPEVGHLVVAAIAIIARANPAFIVFENVIQYADSASAYILRNQLRDMGYEIHETEFYAPDYGSLEERRRWSMVAVTEGIKFDINALVPEPFEVKKVAEALSDVSLDDPSWSEMQGLKDKERRDIQAGKGFRMQVFDGSEDTIKTLTKDMQKNRSTDPKIRHPENKDLLRIPFPEEHAKFKQIPEKLIGGLPKTTAHQILGQSICYEPFRQLAVHLAKSLKDSFVNERMAISSDWGELLGKKVSVCG